MAFLQNAIRCDCADNLATAAGSDTMVRANKKLGRSRCVHRTTAAMKSFHRMSYDANSAEDDPLDISFGTTLK